MFFSLENNKYRRALCYGQFYGECSEKGMGALAIHTNEEKI